MTMSRRTLLGGVAAGAATLAAPQVRAQAAPLKVGVIATTSGGFASWGRQFKQAIDLYMAEKGPRAGGRPVEIIYRDETGADPPRARQLAQELVTRENVDFLGVRCLRGRLAGIDPRHFMADRVAYFPVEKVLMLVEFESFAAYEEAANRHKEAGIGRSGPAES